MSVSLLNMRIDSLNMINDKRTILLDKIINEWWE